MSAIRGVGYIQDIFNLLPHAREHLQCYHFINLPQVFDTLDP